MLKTRNNWNSAEQVYTSELPHSCQFKTTTKSLQGKDSGIPTLLSIQKAHTPKKKIFLKAHTTNRAKSVCNRSVIIKPSNNYSKSLSECPHSCQLKKYTHKRKRLTRQRQRNWAATVPHSCQLKKQKHKKSTGPRLHNGAATVQCDY